MISLKPLVFCLLFLFTISAFSQTDQKKIVVGSKIFTEGYLLSELIAQKLEQKGFLVERRFGLGGTGILFEAVASEVIDIYPEYTGTISKSLLDESETIKNYNVLSQKLFDMGYEISKSFGFNNTYALAMRQDTAEKMQVSKVSHLKAHPNLQVAFSHEFLNRQDGYPGLQQTYNLNFSNIRGIQHALAYNALSSNQIDLTDIYSTDAKVQSLGLKVLDDDLSFFTEYLPVALVKKGFKEKFPGAWASIQSLENSIDESTMINMNSKVDIDKIPYEKVIADFIQPSSSFQTRSLFSRVMQRTQEHILLVLIALFFSLLIGFPLGIIATENTILEKIILNITSLVQTIPSLALLCFLIPFFGIGEISALIALILYGLLPIVINTFTGIKNIDNKHNEVASALGLSWWESLIYIKIPIASPSILAGIKTSVIIGIGTATLSALIGAGGYGVPIMTGLALTDTSKIFEGAIPAAMMAIFANIILEQTNKILIPKGLK